MALGSIFKKTAVGLDIGDRSVEAIQLSGSINQPYFTSYGRTILPGEIVEKGRIIDKNSLGQAIKQTFSNAEPNPINEDTAVVTVPDMLVYTSIVSIPDESSNQEDSKMILREAQNMLPIALEDASFDMYEIETLDKISRHFFFAAIELSVLSDYLEVLQKAGIKVAAVDFEPLSAARAIIPEKVTKDWILLDVGANKTTFTAFRGDKAFFNSSILIAGDQITSVLAKGMQTTGKEAEDIKRSAQRADRADKIIYGQIDQIYRETDNYIDFVKNRLQLNPTELLITGGISLMPKFAEWTQNYYTRQSLQVDFAKPYFQLGEKAPGYTLYLNSLGLALRSLAENPSAGFNLLLNREKKLNKAVLSEPEDLLNKQESTQEGPKRLEPKQEAEESEEEEKDDQQAEELSENTIPLAEPEMYRPKSTPAEPKPREEAKKQKTEPKQNPSVQNQKQATQPNAKPKKRSVLKLPDWKSAFQKLAKKTRNETPKAGQAPTQRPSKPKKPIRKKRADTAQKNEPEPKTREKSEKVKLIPEKRRLKTLVVAFCLAFAALAFLLILRYAKPLKTETEEPETTTTEATPRESFYITFSDTVTTDTPQKGKIVTEQIQRTLEVTASGEEDIEDYASGEATIFNDTDIDQTIVTNSRLATKDELLFRTQSRLEIPANGSVDVEIVASEKGASGNIEPQKLTFVALPDSLINLIYAETAETLTGGTRLSAEISQSDINSAAQAKIIEIEDEEALEIIDWAAAVDLTKYRPVPQIIDVSVSNARCNNKCTATYSVTVAAVHKTWFETRKAEALEDELTPEKSETANLYSVDEEVVTIEKFDLTAKRVDIGFRVLYTITEQ